eukprot:gb/GEZN01005265.1/.p1 GENE.gb/GEZN01005265.1/~~gb/GEZN01005265.1/.p1  ORF type:complete len:514 (-),score=92.15 gb/GEZN01005265.1/:288-1634(-)
MTLYVDGKSLKEDEDGRRGRGRPTDITKLSSAPRRNNWLGRWHRMDQSTPVTALISHFQIYDCVLVFDPKSSTWSTLQAQEKKEVAMQAAVMPKFESTVETKKLLAEVDFKTAMEWIRCVRGDTVGRGDVESSKAIWKAEQKELQDQDYFTKLGRKGIPDFFISHVWAQPPLWDETGQPESEGHIKGFHGHKAHTIYGTLEQRGVTMFDKTVWIDKVCMPQKPELLQFYGKHNFFFLEFLALSKEVVVILQWNYFQRLWCLYEWSSMLALKGVDQIHLGIADILCRCKRIPDTGEFDEYLARKAIMKVYLDSIENCSVKNAKCFKESDRAVLLRQVNLLFYSEKHFEDFATIGAIGLLALQLLTKAYTWPMVPSLRDLASKKGLNELAAAIDSGIACKPDYLPCHHQARAMRWFKEDVQPILDQAKQDNVRVDVVQQINAMAAAQLQS